MQKLSWREKYAGLLVLLIGIIFLLIQVASLMSNKSHAYSFQNNALVINKNELFSDLRTYLVILMGVIAGLMLLKNKRAGWVLGLPVLLLIVTIAVTLGVEQFKTIRTNKQAMIIFGSVLFLLFLGILFLFLPSARKKYRASAGAVVLTLLLYGALTGVYFFLQ